MCKTFMNKKWSEFESAEFYEFIRKNIKEVNQKKDKIYKIFNDGGGSTKIYFDFGESINEMVEFLNVVDKLKDDSIEKK